MTYLSPACDAPGKKNSQGESFSTDIHAPYELSRDLIAEAFPPPSLHDDANLFLLTAMREARVRGWLMGSEKLFQKSASGFSQVRGVEALAKPAIGFFQQLAALRFLALLVPQARQARGRPQFQ